MVVVHDFIEMSCGKLLLGPTNLVFLLNFHVEKLFHLQLHLFLHFKPELLPSLEFFKPGLL